MTRGVAHLHRDRRQLRQIERVVIHRRNTRRRQPHFVANDLEVVIRVIQQAVAQRVARVRVRSTEGRHHRRRAHRPFGHVLRRQTNRRDAVVAIKRI